MGWGGRPAGESWRPEGAGPGSAGATGPGPSEEEAPSQFQRAASTLARVLATLSKSNAVWLKQKSRKSWWKRSEYPLIPGDKEWAPGDPLGQLAKMAPLGLLFFCASFNLTLLQNMRDALIVTTGGAERLPFLAAYCVLPASLGFFMYYNSLLQRVRPERVFYFAVTPLLAFYAVFVAFVFPNADTLHLHHLADVLSSWLPLGMQGLVGVVTDWTYSLFFCLAELWGTVVISVLFWGLANEVCTVSEAKSVYPLLGIAANVALVFGGHYVKFVSALSAGSTLASFRMLVGSILAMSGLMFATKWFLDRQARARGGEAPAAPKKKGKKKSSWGDIWSDLSGSPKIRNLSLLVVGYALSHRLFEVAWKSQLKVLYPTAQAYQGALADVSIATGTVTIFMMLAGRYVFQAFGWNVAAATTPLVMMLSGLGFFALSLGFGAGFQTIAGVPLMMAAVGVGSVTQIFARSSKFSLFDPAKEMVYIEMSREEKARGKAAVDMVGSQVGKSGASWITQGLLLAFGSIQAAIPVIGAMFGIIIAVWINAVRQLNLILKASDEETSP